MTTTNVPAPIRPTDGDAIIAVLAEQAKRQERNVNDPTPWIYVGSGAPAPPFINGSNVGGTKVPLRYRFLRPYDPDADQSAVEIQGSVTGVSLGATIFTLLYPLWNPDGSVPAGNSPFWPVFTLDYDLHLPASDDAGGFVVFTVLQSGDVAYGFV